MAQAGYDPHGELLLSGCDVPERDGRTLEGSVEPILCISGESAWAVVSSQEAYLRFAEAWDPGWKAWVDGARAEVLRADYLFSAVRVPAGDHVVVFRHDPAGWQLALQALSLLAGAAAVLFLVAGAAEGRRACQVKSERA